MRKKIADWAENDSTHSVCWMHGAAGTGKSTICTSFVEKLRKEGRLGSFQFFLRGKSSCGNIIRTIAYDLAHSNSSVAAAVITAASSNDLISAPMSTQFNELLLKPLQHYSKEGSEPMVVVLDALDESGDAAQRAEILELLADKFDELKHAIRVFVTSRPEGDIVDAFADKPAIQILDLATSSEESRRDVFNFLMDKLPPLVKVATSWDWKKVISDLAKASDGLFIWAATSVKLVAASSFPLKTLKSLMQNAQSLGLNDLYESALQNALQWDAYTRDIFGKVMTVIVFGKHEIRNYQTIDELLGLPEEESSINILSKLQSLLTFEPNKPISFHHTSFPDYLMAPERKKDPWFVDVKETLQFFTKRCFTYMKENLRFNLCDIPSSLDFNKNIKDLPDRVEKSIQRPLRYACIYSAHHLAETEYSDEMAKVLQEFLETRFTFWLEVLSVLGRVDEAGPALLRGIQWIGVRRFDFIHCTVFTHSHLET